MKKLRFLPKFKPIKVLLGMIVSFVLILSYIVACSDNDPIEDQPLPDPIADETPDPIADEDLITVDTDGGVFILPSGIEVTIPQGAVTTEKEIQVDVLDIADANALTPITIPANTAFLSGISVATDVFDFKEPISLKLPLQNMDENSLAILYELESEMNSWLFSDEIITVNHQDSSIEIILKVSDEKSKQKHAKDLNSIRSFFLKIYGDIFLSEDSCRKISQDIRNLDYDKPSETCDAVLVHEEITYPFCDPPQKGSYIAQEIGSECKPELNITPPGKLKVKKDESQSIQLTTSVGGFALSQQEIKLSATDDNLLITTPVLITDGTGNASFDVKGMEVGEGKITLSVTFKYALTTIIAISNELTKEYPYDVETRKLDVIINIEVYDKLKVTTDAVTNFTSTTATISGNVTDDGGETVTERGVHWGKSAEPENKLPLGSGLGGFIGNLADLEPDTDYYVKAYAINKDTTAYGEIVSFKTLDEKCEVTTSLDTNYECDSATVGGNVICEGDATATERGIFLDGVKMQSGSGTGSFTVDLTDLEENTTYTVQAYVTSDADIELGEQITFTTPECELIDIDGNVYKTVKIGTQVWMAENLKTTRYNDGTPITYSEDKWEWNSTTTTKIPYYTWYDNDVENKDVYGALYNWWVVGTGKLCPTGWHIMSEDEALVLADYLGGYEVAGGKLKEKGTAHWEYPNTGATDEYGFTALPGGYRLSPIITYDGEVLFRKVGYLGIWWTSTEEILAGGESSRWSAHYGKFLYDSSASIIVNNHSGSSTHKSYGFSCRCIKD